ncbi:MAG: glycoside hydrolase family 5 protein [Acidimicrobiales bacterium]
MGRTGFTARRAPRAATTVVALASLLGGMACSGGDDDDDAAPDDREVTDEGEEVSSDGMPRLHAERGSQPGIFDEDGRQVILRAVNLNSLAEYAQNHPDYEPTRPLTGDDWDQIAAEGFNAVRLLVSWSRLEPERGQIDADYVEQIRQAVGDAANRGLYTVIDMHQDAWGPFVATPPGSVCAPGLEPSNGWDGAPEWATPSPTELDSCRPVDGEDKPGSELVTEAWHRFYTDADGVQGRLVAVWQHLAESLADEPSVAGYDLLNEPGHGRGDTAPAALLAELAPLGDFYARAIDAIRDGESEAGIEPRPIFFEPTVLGSPPPADFSDDPGLVYAPHVYGGSIVTFITVDQHWDIVAGQAATFETSLWIGEYGWFDDPVAHPELVERLERFAVREDGGVAADAPSSGAAPPGRAPYVPAGSAWWEWTNACGDPHRITDRGLTPQGDVWQYRLVTCPDGEDHGVVPQWRDVVTRAYPRYAPGWLVRLESPSTGAGGGMVLAASEAEPGAVVELWVPGELEPEVDGTGIVGVATRRSGLGWNVTAEVCAEEYTVTVGDNAIPRLASCDEAGDDAAD